MGKDFDFIQILQKGKPTFIKYRSSLIVVIGKTFTELWPFLTLIGFAHGLRY